MKFSEIAGNAMAALKRAGATVLAWWAGLEKNTREHITDIAIGVVLGIPVGVWLA